MRLTPDSGTLLMRGRAHWLRGAFMDTTLADDIVTLAPAVPPVSGAPVRAFNTALTREHSQAQALGAAWGTQHSVWLWALKWALERVVWLRAWVSA